MTLPPTEGERLGRMEEQIGFIREDVQEIKTSIKDDNREMKDTVKEFTTTLANLPHTFLLRQEAEKMSERMDGLESRVSKAERKLMWYGGIGATIVFLIGIVAGLFRNGVIK